MDTDPGAGTVLEEPRIGALYPDYGEATLRLNGLTADDVIAVRNAATAAEADIDTERLQFVVRACLRGGGAELGSTPGGALQLLT